MKLKIITLLIILVIGLSIFFSGCTDSVGPDNNTSTGQEPEISETDEPIKVAVSVVPQAEFVEKVGGDKVKTVVIIPPGADPHTYELSPKEVQEISKASMFVTVGVGMPFEEVWIDRFESMNSGTLVVNCSRGLELRELDEHSEENEIGNNEEHEELDPHIWTSPAN
ncbi:MAG TPA: zinc ABC transporter solute-binding protein, partial [Methanosarcina sp.]|nr:zinc ABC transporter solute-binding protein [Methanosarcina sp.]